MKRLIGAAWLCLALATAASAQDPWAAYRVPTDWPGHTYTPSPQDWRHLAVYQVMTDRFYNGDPSNDTAHNFSTPHNAPAHEHPTEGWRRTLGGDLDGLTQHLDYVKALGLELDATGFGMGLRGERFAIIVDDGVATHVAVEAPGQFEVSSAEAIAEKL